MSLAIGARLGPYEVLGPIGAGGMGEVYKARDTRLDRTVAIKVLPPGFAADHERRARFEREAKAVATLNHPNICTLYDVGDHEESLFLVMEHLAGETLADRLRKGPLPFEQALTIAIAVADALAVAHRQGIIHRDLKPGNVMLTKSGVAAPSAVHPKLLDFGLAKKTPCAVTEITVTAAAAQDPMTGVGMVVGTVPYMAPEQLEGKETDARSDIFSFGAVLYEMLTGRRAFDGESQASVIAAVLEHDPPPVATVQPITPPALDRLVRKCLQKNPDARWQSAADVADELRWVATEHGGVARVERENLRRPWGRSLMAGGTGVTVVLLGAVLWFTAGRWASGVGSASLKLQIAVSPAAGTLTDGGVAISPDGHAVVFVVRRGDVSQLYIRRLDEWTARPLAGTEGGSQPFFSPDGRWVGFVSGTKAVQKVPLDEGPPQLVWRSDGSSGEWITGGAWGTDGIVIGRWPQAGLWLIPEEGGSPRGLLPGGKAVDWYLWPEVLPESKGVLFTLWSRGTMSIALLPRNSSAIQVLIPSGSRPRYVPTGHLLYEADRKLMAVAFDIHAVRPYGRSVAIFGELPEAQWWGSWRESTVGRTYDLSRNGTIVYTPASPTLPTLVWKDRHGNATPVPLERRRYSMPALSPDGRYVADTIYDGPKRSIWIGRTEGGSMSRLTLGDDDCYSLFSRDGKFVYFTANRDGRYNVFRIPSDRSAEPDRVTDGPGAQRPTSWSPDGSILLFNNITPPNSDIVAMHGAQIQPVAQTSFRERNAAFGPDGKWIAYESNESGTGFEIYVQAYPAGPRIQISNEGGVGPVWNPRGGELFYQGPQGVMSARVVEGRLLGAPVLLFPHKNEFRDWDVRSDGERFLVVEGSDASRFPPYINVSTNWFDELKAKVTVEK